MIRLGAGVILLKKYRDLKPEELRVSTIIMKPNAPGQRNVALAWFWNVELEQTEGPRDDLLTECECRSQKPFMTINQIVYRVHFLRALARYDRWEEEELVTGYEMIWTRRYFDYRQMIWCKYAKGPLSTTPGHTNYAMRQAATWGRMAVACWALFLQANPGLHNMFGAEDVENS